MWKLNIYLNNQNYEKLIKIAQQSVDYAKLDKDKENVEKYKWYLEITSILIELKKRNEESKRCEQENLENPNKDEEKERLDEIKEKRRKSSIIEFIEFVLDKYPPIRNPVRRGKTVRDLWNEDKKSFIEKLSVRYNPDNYPRNTDQENLKNKICHYIYSELNCILSEL